MNKHTEIHFEDEICAHLAAHGWLHEDGDDARYDRARALFLPDVTAWVRETQPQAWESLVKNHGARAGEALEARLRDQLDARGTLDVLRHGVELIGLRAPVRMAEFRPAFSMNADITARYRAVRLRVVRQLRYSMHNENRIDLALFVNGLPVATVELKTDFTQSVADAVDQYRFDRAPRAKNGAAEPLLSFPGGALVHFAVSNREVRMTTRLSGPETIFLPFNQGDGGAAGNPPDPRGGHRTAYLWERIWERESWLEILGRFVTVRRNAKKQVDAVIFPRYHQLDAVRRLQSAVRAEGPGGRYLIQHSAGSGKTNSIAWAAHFLAELHDGHDRKVFDSVLVVSDRNVIDAQLQETLFDFQRQAGVVATITTQEGSKSAALAAALDGTKKIVVCTIQTFPYALDFVRDRAATQGKRYAVIADEAHSSQAGEAAAKLRAVLSAEELRDLSDGGEVAVEDVLAAQMAARADERGVTFVAFTATPKSRTLELFGTRPDPTRKPAPDNVPAPFHVYSMRQAIEEGFILDVLRNYTTYGMAFTLAHAEGEVDDVSVERSAAKKRMMGWVRLHPYNIAQKVHIVVEHFRAHVAPLLDGRAKAMVVLASRVEAVRWQLAVEKYIAECGYAIGALAAFSGEVDDAESSPEPLRETSRLLNPGLRGRDIREAFKGDDYQLLLVANKFQTGFDQPLLCGMYVDKRLGGVQAVQTLSRLNRAMPGKDTTYVLDFVNDPQEILAAFKTYYDTAKLEDVSDPNLVFDLRARLDAAGHYDDGDVERVVRVELRPDATQAQLWGALERVVDRLLKAYRHAQARRGAQDAASAQAARDEIAALEQFKSDMDTFVRVYTFLSQIFDYGNTDIEKRAIFYRRLLPLLEFGREREQVDLSKVVLTRHRLYEVGRERLNLQEGEAPAIAPITEAGSAVLRERERAYLREVIEQLNELFGGETSDNDQLVYVNHVLLGKLLESETLRRQASANTRQQFSISPDLDDALLDAVAVALEAHEAMSARALQSTDVRQRLKQILLEHSGLYEKLRG